jgi:hypothetical protein
MKLCRICKGNYANNRAARRAWRVRFSLFEDGTAGIFPLTTVRWMRLYGIINFTYIMPNDSQPKRQALQATGTFNPRV